MPSIFSLKPYRHILFVISLICVKIYKKIRCKSWEIILRNSPFPRSPLHVIAVLFLCDTCLLSLLEPCSFHKIINLGQIAWHFIIPTLCHYFIFNVFSFQQFYVTILRLFAALLGADHFQKLCLRQWLYSVMLFDITSLLTGNS